jgi:hypothetical protein
MAGELSVIHELEINNCSEIKSLTQINESLYPHIYHIQYKMTTAITSQSVGNILYNLITKKVIFDYGNLLHNKNVIKSQIDIAVYRRDPQNYITIYDNNYMYVYEQVQIENKLGFKIYKKRIDISNNQCNINAIDSETITLPIGDYQPYMVLLHQTNDILMLCAITPDGSMDTKHMRESNIYIINSKTLEIIKEYNGYTYDFNSGILN